MKTVRASVSSKGQVVLPKEVRARLGVERGDEVEFVMDEAGIHLRPKRAGENPFLAWIGAAPSGESWEEFARQSRYAGLDEEDLRILRTGPGAKVTRLGRTDDEAGAS